MTDFQLVLVIALPILINCFFTAALVMIVNSRISDVNGRIADLRMDMSARFASLEKFIDQRFESLEREIHKEDR